MLAIFHMQIYQRTWNEIFLRINDGGSKLGSLILFYIRIASWFVPPSFLCSSKICSVASTPPWNGGLNPTPYQSTTSHIALKHFTHYDLRDYKSAEIYKKWSIFNSVCTKVRSNISRKDHHWCETICRKADHILTNRRSSLTALYIKNEVREKVTKGICFAQQGVGWSLRLTRGLHNIEQKSAWKRGNCYAALWQIPQKKKGTAWSHDFRSRIKCNSYLNINH